MCKDNQEVHWQLLNDINSEKRMRPYLEEFPNSPICALEMYLWNTKISAQFWQVIGFTEIALRNRIDQQLSRKSIVPGYSWFQDPKIVRPGSLTARKVAKASDLLRRSGKNVSHERILTELNLSFWQQLVSRANRNLWPDISRGFASHKTIEPETFAELVEEFHQFRNRIAHHNKIWHLDLYSKYLVMIEILEKIDPQFSAFVMSKVVILEFLGEEPKCRNQPRE
jgi:abortive infection bacteriophage resistance protein